MAHTLDLPPELRGLVALFEQDDRPSAILGDQDAAIYQNESFKHLEPTISDVISELQRTEGPHGEAQVAVVRGKIWKRCWVAEGWSTLTYNGDMSQVQPEATPEPALFEGMLEPALAQERRADQHSPGSTVSIISYEAGALLDWTRFDIPDISSWIKFVRDFDWTTTDLGPMSSWCPQLRQCVVNIMNNPEPRLLIWGAGQTFVYNEACIPLWGKKHPRSFGKPMYEAFEEIWTEVGHLIEGALKGKPMRFSRLQVMMGRSDNLEETYFDFSLVPIVGPHGRTVGVLDELVETTKLVTNERRRLSVVSLTEQIARASTLKELWPFALSGLEGAVEDVPFAIFYSIMDVGEPQSSADGAGAIKKKCVLQGKMGLAVAGEEIIETFDLVEQLETGPSMVDACLRAWKTREPVTLSSEDASLPPFLTAVEPGRAFGDRVHTAMVVPIHPMNGTEVFGLLLLGLNPRSPFDQEYGLWAHLVAELLNKTASLISLPEEQRRALKIADEINNSLSDQLAVTTLAAERSESKFKRMADSAPTGMYMFDGEGRTLAVNDAYLEMLGMTREQHVNLGGGPDFTSWSDLVHPDDLEIHFGGWETVLATKGPITVEYRLRKPWQSIDKATGQTLIGERWLLANAFPDVNADGQVTAVLGWLTDISHRKFSEKLLTQQLEDALENKRQTENFIDMTSHEMRNPLSAILQSADSIVSSLTSAEVKGDSVQVPSDLVRDILDSAQTVILCGQHQKRIVDDILTLSKLDASLLVISPDEVRPPSLAEKALKMYESELARAEIRAELCIEQSCRDLDVDWVILDSSRLLQIIINLLTNAIKFTQHADERQITISLGASRERPTGEQHNVRFIPVRAPREAPSPAESGDGEELFLQIAVTDSGHGLTPDEMKLLFHRFSQASPKTYKQYGGSGLGLFISRELCELQGGQIGVNSVPGKTTFTFFVRARRWVPEPVAEPQQDPSWPRNASTSASPLVYGRRGGVLYSGPVTNGARELPSGNGSIAEEPSFIVPRPHGPNEADDAVDGSINVRTNGDSLHVLVVEDNVINQRVMSKQLRLAGCSAVYVANHGLECLSFLERSTFCAAATPLSVVLLDLEMPLMDGLTCIRHIREQQRIGKILKHVPVIAVTANARSEQISAALSAGMDQVVTKPFRIPELMPQMTALVAEIAQRYGG